LAGSGDVRQSGFRDLLAERFGFNINEHVIVANSSGATGVSTASDTYFTNNPTFGFSQLVTLATIRTRRDF